MNQKDAAVHEKTLAANAALEYVKPGMTVGLGTGSTAAIFIKKLGELNAKRNLRLRCVPTSSASETLAKECGLNVIMLDEAKSIDLAVDGADLVDSKKNLIKGYGGALTREKVVEYSAKKFIVIADSSKESKKLDKPIPVEYLPFAKFGVESGLYALGARKIEQRLSYDKEPYRTDNGLLIVDADFGKISSPAKLEKEINQIPGVLENGLFAKNVSKVIFGEKKGVREI